MSDDQVPWPTEALFREDSRLTECVAHVRAVDARGVRLDRTVFYPQGGGQAGDAGELILADGTRLAIADTRKGEAPGEIVHVPAAEPSDALGQLHHDLATEFACSRRRCPGRRPPAPSHSKATHLPSGWAPEATHRPRPA